MSGISELNPFVGPRPIQQGEQLHGRKREVRELSEHLRGHRIVVLHSPSGAGKSSLVQAGLIPRLRKNKFDVWKPIRVNLDPASYADVPAETNRYLLSALVSLEDELPDKHRRSPAELARLGFLDYLDGRPRRKNRAAHSVVLLFDQFEEILSIGPRAIEAKRAFFAAVGEALDTGRYWALFIIREDYLAALAPYRDRIPTQMSNTYRLDLLGLDGAREAATELARSGGRSFPAAEKLVQDLSVVQVQQSDGSFVAEQGIHIEPVYLQVVCRRLWAAMPDDDASIDAEDIEAYAKVSQSLAGYYADAVKAIAGDDVGLARAIRDWVGNRLIVGGIRSQVRQEARANGGLAAAHIEGLLDSYLIRMEQRAGANWYELSHDRLVEPVLEANELWQQAHLHPLQVQAKLWEGGGRARSQLLGPDALPDASEWAVANPGLLTKGEREFLELSRAQLAEQLAARRRQRAFTAVLAIVAVLAIGFGVLANIAQRESDRQRKQAEDAKADADEARLQAEHAKTDAEHAKLRAEDAKTDAEHAKLRAEKTQKENERSVRQMFEVALRPVTERLIKERTAAGIVELDERWTPLLARDGRAIVAASMGQSFRIVVAGHGSVLSEADKDHHSLFLEITAQWLLADQAQRRVAIVTQRPGTYRRLEALERNLLTLEYEYDVDVSLADNEALAEAGMLILDNCQAPALGDTELATIEAFVRRGGGVLAVGLGQGWLSGEGLGGGAEPPLDNYPMNVAMAAFGARWTDAIIEPEALERREEPAIVRFENKLDVEVNLYTRNAEREEYYTTLAPGADRELLTALGREWIFRAAGDDRQLGTAVIDEKEQVETIGATGVKVRPKPRPRPKREPEGGDADSTTKAGSQLRETLSKTDVDAGLVDAKRAAKKCGGDLETLLSFASVELEVGADGKVTRAHVLPPVKGTPEATCVEDALSKLRFPRSRKGGAAKWKLKLY